MQVTRALTVLEPWAMLLASGHKLVENRTWPTEFRGPVAIHAGSSMAELYSPDVAAMLDDLADIYPQLAELFTLPLLPGDNPKKPKISSIYHHGCIVGTVEIFDCVAFAEGDDFEKLCRDRGHSEWYEAAEIPPAEFASGPFCFLCRDAKQFTQPPPARGALNFWYLDNPRNPGLAATVAAALKRPLGSPYHYRRRIAETRKPTPAA